MQDACTAQHFNARTLRSADAPSVSFFRGAPAQAGYARHAQHVAELEARLQAERAALRVEAGAAVAAAAEAGEQQGLAAMEARCALQSELW